MQSAIDLNRINVPIESMQLDLNDHNKVKLEIFAEEVLDKIVTQSGNSGRIYLPPKWIGHKVKIVRIV